MTQLDCFFSKAWKCVPLAAETSAISDLLWKCLHQTELARKLNCNRLRTCWINEFSFPYRTCLVLHKPRSKMQLGFIFAQYCTSKSMSLISQLDDQEDSWNRDWQLPVAAALSVNNTHLPPIWFHWRINSDLTSNCCSPSYSSPQELTNDSSNSFDSSSTSNPSVRPPQ